MAKEADKERKRRARYRIAAVIGVISFVGIIVVDIARGMLGASWMFMFVTAILAYIGYLESLPIRSEPDDETSDCGPEE